MAKVVCIGSVQSSKVALEALIHKGLMPLMVYGVDEGKQEGIAGYCSLCDVAESYGIKNKRFKKVSEIVDEIIQIEPDYVFAIGLSQLLPAEMLNSVKGGVIGVHPAPLPLYRGRAAMVWQMLLGLHETKISLFFIDEGIDSGDIIVQVPMTIEDTDYAIDVDRKGLIALEKGVEAVADMILNGNVVRTPQDHSKAVYLLKRTPEDGEICWDKSSESIQRLIRAVSQPFPGAFSYYDGVYKVIIWKAEYVVENTKYIGLNGQICEISDQSIDVLCGNGILKITDYEIFDENNQKCSKRMLVGHKLRSRK